MLANRVRMGTSKKSDTVIIADSPEAPYYGSRIGFIAFSINNEPSTTIGWGEEFPLVLTNVRTIQFSVNNMVSPSEMGVGTSPLNPNSFEASCDVVYTRNAEFNKSDLLQITTNTIYYIGCI